MTGDTAHYCEISRDWLTCNSGYYNKAFNDYPDAMYDTRYKTITDLLANACIPVEAGYWSENESLTRTACTSGLTTLGYGTGANDAGDCGRILHAGENKIYLRSEKRTEPSLNIRVDDVTYYGNMSTTVSGPLKVNYNGTIYSVVTDWE